MGFCQNLINLIKNNKILQFILIIILTIFATYFLMPSKTTIKNFQTEIEKYKIKIEEILKEKEVLIVQNNQLKNKSREKGLIIEYPDGTKVTTYDNIKESEEISNLYASMKESYESKIAEKDKEINYLKEYNKTEINKRFVTIMALGSYNKDIKAVSGLIQADVINRLGIVGGGGFDWNSQAAIIHGGISYKF